MNATAHEKIVLITGAARRIGAAIACHFHERHYKVIIHYKDSKEDAEGLQQRLNKRRPDSAICLQAELCDIDSVTKLAEAALAWHGAIDVLVNNASSFYPSALGEITEPVWDELMGSNLKGGFFLAQALAPTLRARAGCIINLADMHADGGLKAYPVYSIAKAGVKMMTKVLARELAPMVRVNAISPGVILWPEHEECSSGVADTQQAILDKVALQRSGAPEDIAACAWYLAEKALYSTGQTIRVDGGRAA